jgi:hypothetical protein
MRRLFSFIGILAIASSSVVLAQDTRTVVEPKIPVFCATLDAHLTSVNDGKFNTLAPADESKPDTGRIQKAIDQCAKGQGVALQVHGNANAFLSGPLQLREGVTLVVDKGVTLFESLDPQALEVTPGSCGVVDSAPGRGCKPLISVDHVSGAGVMGDGVIDGRGGEKRGSWPSRPAPAAARRSAVSLSPITPTTLRSIASPSRTLPTSTSRMPREMASRSGESRSIRHSGSPATRTASTPAAARRTSPSLTVTFARGTITSPSRAEAPANSPT